MIKSLGKSDPIAELKWPYRSFDPTLHFTEGKTEVQREQNIVCEWQNQKQSESPYLALKHGYFSRKEATRMNTSQHLNKASVHFSSVTQSCPTLCDLMNHSTPGLPVQHQFPEFTQTHIHRVSDNHPAFSSCPQSLPASESFPMSQLFA